MLPKLQESCVFFVLLIIISLEGLESDVRDKSYQQYQDDILLGGNSSKSYVYRNPI